VPSPEDDEHPRYISVTGPRGQVSRRSIRVVPITIGTGCHGAVF